MAEETSSYGLSREEREKKRIEIGVEAVKQQITLATGVIGLAIAFSDQLTGESQSQMWWIIRLAFGALGLSVVFGILTLMSIAFYLGTEEDPFDASVASNLGVLQNILFMLSILSMAFFITFG